MLKWGDMDFKDDSSAANMPVVPLTDEEPVSQFDQNLLTDMDEMDALPPLPVGDIYAIPVTEEPRSVHEPRQTIATKVRTYSNYGLALTLFFLANFGIGILIATMLWTGDLDPVMDMVKSFVRSFK